MKKIIFGLIFSALLVSCNEQNAKMEKNVKDTAKSLNLGDSAKPAIVTNLNDEYVFIGGDTITVVFLRNIASDKNILASMVQMFYNDVDPSQHPTATFQMIKSKYGDLSKAETFLNRYSKKQVYFPCLTKAPVSIDCFLIKIIFREKDSEI
jgi:hypothetical protein